MHSPPAAEAPEAVLARPDPAASAVTQRTAVGLVIVVRVADRAVAAVQAAAVQVAAVQAAAVQAAAVQVVQAAAVWQILRLPWNDSWRSTPMVMVH